MSQRPSLEAFQQDICTMAGRSDLWPPVAEVVQDFWTYWSQIESGIASGNLSLSVDMLTLGRLNPQYRRYHTWKGLGILLLVVALVFVWFQPAAGIVLALIGIGLQIYGRRIYTADGQRFMGDVISDVKRGKPGAMTTLCGHYIAGSVELVAGQSRTCWPLYPSNVITKRLARVQLPS